MTLKEFSNVIGTSTCIICKIIEYDNVALHMKSNVLSANEFKTLVKKSDTLANMLVDGVFTKDNNLYICIY